MTTSQPDKQAFILTNQTVNALVTILSYIKINLRSYYH